jgi:hypothetical protein
MKKRISILLFVISTLLPQIVSAQLKTTDFQFGFKIAPNFGWLKPDTEGYDFKGLRLGFNWGFVAEYKMSENIRLQSGFNVLMHGGKLEYPHAITTNTTTGTINESGTMLRRYSYKYIEIPVVVKMTTNEIGYFRYFGVIGLGTGLNISAKAIDEFSVTDPVDRLVKGEPKIKSSTRFIREALILGLGAQYNFSGNTDLVFGVNFNNGFTNVLKGSNKVTGFSETAISNFIELNIGVLF